MIFSEYLRETLESEDEEAVAKKKKKKKEGKLEGWATNPEGLLRYLQKANAAQR